MVVRLSLTFCFSTLFFFHGKAQNNIPTDPLEVIALDAIFRHWKISSEMSTEYRWNISDGNPCTGASVDAPKDVMESPDDYGFNPAVLCDCDENICHIIRLVVHKLNVSGTIPNELANLTRLDNLQIGENYIYGPLPPFIGKFEDMKYMSIGVNALSGPLPKELGNLTNLISLGIALNNFSGPLPAEIGNMSSLEQMYIGSLGLSGEIPKELGKLGKLEVL